MGGGVGGAGKGTGGVGRVKQGITLGAWVLMYTVSGKSITLVCMQAAYVHVDATCVQRKCDNGYEFMLQL